MDARFPCHYLNDRRVMRLPAEHFRAFVLATAWAVSNATEGRIEADELSLIPFCLPASAAALVQAGLWLRVGDGWQIADYADTQTSKEQLDGLKERRRNDAARKARSRAKAKAAPDVSPTRSASASRDGHGTERRDLSREDIGKASARKSKALDGGTTSNGQITPADEHSDATASPVMDWPTVAIPGSVELCRVVECGQALTAPTSRAAGVCAKQDAAHRGAAEPTQGEAA